MKAIKPENYGIYTIVQKSTLDYVIGRIFADRDCSDEERSDENTSFESTSGGLIYVPVFKRPDFAKQLREFTIRDHRSPDAAGGCDDSESDGNPTSDSGKANHPSSSESYARQHRETDI